MPSAYVRLADPGPCEDRELTDRALRRAAEIGSQASRTAFATAARLGVRELPVPAPRCSVVVCTHRRPELAAQAVDALLKLDPAAAEVILVDNAPGDADCSDLARRTGVRYIRERRRGQNWARAAGFAAASSDLVAFTDDDVVVSPRWLEPLAELFADPSVGAVTGAAFGRRTDTDAQELREAITPFIPAAAARRFDWTTLRPAAAGATGAGANMIFRRELLAGLDGVFTPDLDPGTPARSGGDLYILYRVLAAGRRIVFDPRLHAEHEHGREDSSLLETLRGYGTGYAALLTKLLVEHRESTALVLWWWLANRLLDAALTAAMDPASGHPRLRWQYLLGGLRGPDAWVRARRAQRDRTPAPSPVWAGSHPSPPRAPSGMVVIDADSAPERNRRAERASGELLLFLCPGGAIDEGLGRRHAERHAASDGERIVAGRVEPVGVGGGLAGQLAVLRHEDHFEAMRRSAALTFADLPAENFSLSRALFDRLGGFDERLGLSPSAHELALRALREGVRLEYEPEAVLRRPVALSTREALETARRTGRDHARILLEHPIAAGALPETVAPVAPYRGSSAHLGRLPPGAICRSGPVLAGALERLRLRGTWHRVLRLLVTAAYRAGEREAGPRARGRRIQPPILCIDLADRQPIPAPTIAAPVVDLRAAGRPLGRLPPPGGQWSSALATAAVGRLRFDDWRALDVLPDPPPPQPPAGGLEGIRVVYGPGRRRGDERHAQALAAAGARVEILDGPPSEHWVRCAAALHGAQEELVAFPLPGVIGTPEWLRAARVPLAGSRVAVVCGAGLTAQRAPLPTRLVSRALQRGRYRAVGHATQFLLVRTVPVRACGGLRPAAARFGAQGPVLELMDRVMDAGWVVAYQETPGLVPAGTARPARSVLEWQRARSRGGLLADAMLEAGTPSALALLGVHLVLRPLHSLLFGTLSRREPSTRIVVGNAAGEGFGALMALLGRREPLAR